MSMTKIAESDNDGRESEQVPVSTVYGPVDSWRFGKSLGIDLIRTISTCSFNCIYCQLGNIQKKTIERQYFVSTAEVLADLEKSQWQEADIITLSGSGEPTLALNCGEVIQILKSITGKPVKVLTNGTLLSLPEVREELAHADEVAVKLDAANEANLQRVNRPAAGITFNKLLLGIQAFREIYRGKFSLQIMFMPATLKAIDELVELIRQIQPDEIQLNTPKRPYPLEWTPESRGNDPDYTNHPTVALKTISPEIATEVERALADKTGIPILSIYHS